MLVELIMWSRNSFSFVIVVLIATWQKNEENIGGQKGKAISTKFIRGHIKIKDGLLLLEE